VSSSDGFAPLPAVRRMQCKPLGWTRVAVSPAANPKRVGGKGTVALPSPKHG